MSTPSNEQQPQFEQGDSWWQPNPTAAAQPAQQQSFGTAPLPERDLDALPGDEESTRTLDSSNVPMLAALRSRRALAAAAQRDVGRLRESNQDSVFAMITSVPRESRNVQLGLFTVADGMGGHDGGEIASRMAVRAVTRHVLEHLLLPALDDNFADALQPMMIAAVEEANAMIFAHARSVGSDMGTTCSSALLLGSALYIAHVGDSRVYLRTPAGLRQITDDHSAVGRLIQLGQITLEEAREHPLRSQLYRTVGQQPQIAVDFIYQPLGDATHLLLCSDGLWSMLDDAEIEETLEQNLWPQDACQQLIAQANLAGGEDNIAAVVVTLPPAGGNG